MKFKGYRVGIILLVFAVSLGLVIGINWFTHQRRVIAPIYEAFQSIEGVQTVELEEQRQGLNIVLTLGPVNKLEKLMDEIIVELEELGHSRQIIIVDNPSEKLENSFHRMHFIIEQAISLGNFQEMAETIKQIAKEENITHRVYVDKDYVFIQLHQGENYLYHVFNRQAGVNVKREFD